MKALIVEDDFTNRKVLQQLLQPYAECDIAVDGQEALMAFKKAYETDVPYDLICLDIMMPELDGHQVLKEIRSYETERDIRYPKGVKVIMTTALDDPGNVLGAFRQGCEAYVVKPISKTQLVHEMTKLGLIGEGTTVGE